MWFLLLYLPQILTTVLVSLVLAWYLRYQRSFSYWQKRGLPHKIPVFPAGNITPSLLGRKNFYILLQEIYREFKEKGYKHAGLYLFNGPIYFPIDTEVIKDVLTTNFEHFSDRGMFIDEENYPMSSNLFSLPEQRWKTLRAKLTPVFTSAKLKLMYSEIFMENTEVLVKSLSPVALEGSEVNIKNVFVNFTTDIIGKSAFGINFRAMANSDSPAVKIVQNMFNLSPWQVLPTVLKFGFTNPGNLIKFLVANRQLEKLVTEIVKDTVKFREDNQIVCNDFLSLLMEIRNTEGLTLNEMIGQSFLIFAAASETSSTTMTYHLHELAHNPEVQDRLRMEIYQNLGKDYTKFTYDDIFKLPYLNKVFKETLRLYPITGMLNRICVSDYKVPGTDVIIEKGTPVMISTLGLQRDPDHFPEPLKFDPERFNEKSRHTAFSYLPFGEGPRNCIGKRYGQLETKLCVAALVSQFRILPSKVTPREIQFDKFTTSFTLGMKKGIYIKLSKI